jgi:hypothetical protein
MTRKLKLKTVPYKVKYVGMGYVYQGVQDNESMGVQFTKGSWWLAAKTIEYDEDGPIIVFSNNSCALFLAGSNLSHSFIIDTKSIDWKTIVNNFNRRCNNYAILEY